MLSQLDELAQSLSYYICAPLVRFAVPIGAATMALSRAAFTRWLSLHHQEQSLAACESPICPLSHRLASLVF